MTTEHDALFTALMAPFEGWETRERKGEGGQPLFYVTAATVMNRLDDLLGPENWWDSYSPVEGGFLCFLSLRLPGGQVVTKAGVGAGKNAKESQTDSLKRAATHYGIGRYLSRSGVPAFARVAFGEVVEDRPATRPAALPAPAPAPPKRERERSNWAGADAPPPKTEAPASPADGVPRSGRALFAWVQERSKGCGFDLLKQLNRVGKEWSMPGRMVDWDAAQVAFGHREAVRILDSQYADAPAAV